MKVKRESKIGIVIVAAVALLIWGYNFMKGRDIFSHKRIYYAVYSNIAGLSVSNPVYVNGFKVGQIDDIYFHPKQLGKIVVEILITDDFDIPSNTVAMIYSSDLMGSKAIELRLGNSNVLAKPKDTLYSAVQSSLKDEVNMEMLPLKRKVEQLLLSFDSVLAVVQYVFNEKTRENLTRSFESIKFTIQNLEHTSYNLDTLLSSQRNRLAMIVGNVESISNNIKNNNQKIANIINNFSQLSDTLLQANIAHTINNANKSLTQFNDVMAKINSGQGSMGLLLNNDTLYKNLHKSAKEVDLFLEDLRLNPNRYLHFSVFGRGGKKNKYTPPKKAN
ncbi:MAG: MlaD family protein [Bacteroidota bacterium]